MRIIKRAIYWVVKKFRIWLGYAKVYYVSVTGDDETGDGTQEKPWANLSKPLSELKPGDSIYLLPGVYTQSMLLVGESVDIRGCSETE